MGRYSKAIQQLEIDLRDRIHRYFVETGIKKYRLAAEAGISDTHLKGIEDPDFKASLKTLQLLDEVIPEDWEPGMPLPADFEEKLQEIAISHREQAEPVIGYKIWEGEKSQSRKVYLRNDLIEHIEPNQVQRCDQYLSKCRDRDGNLVEGRFKIEVLQSIAPQCAIHVFNIGDTDPHNFFIEKWDNKTGLWHGVDMTGMKFFELEDPAMRSCQIEDYVVCRETMWSSLTFLHRRYESGEQRFFVRLLVPFIGKDGAPRLLSITRPQRRGIGQMILQKTLPDDVSTEMKGRSRIIELDDMRGQ